MNLKRLFLLAAVSLVTLASVLAYSQYPPAPVNDNTASFGSFQILVNPKFASQFAGCSAPYWDPATRIFSSPLLYDSTTTIGVSGVTTEGKPEEDHGVPVGTGPSVTISDKMFERPPGFPEPPNGTREVHTQIRTLNLNTYGGGPSVHVTVKPPTSKPYSAGEVEPQSASGDFPARSFFNVYVQIQLTCGGYNGTLHNDKPLFVTASGLTSLPPVVVYEHDVSSEVPVRTADGRHFGCIILAGHQPGVISFSEGNVRGPKVTRPVEGNKREELNRQAEAFQRHMKEAEGRRPHGECKEEKEDKK